MGITFQMAPKVKMAYEVDIPYLFLTGKTTGAVLSFFSPLLSHPTVGYKKSSQVVTAGLQLKPDAYQRGREKKGKESLPRTRIKK